MRSGGMLNNAQQAEISEQRRMPVDNINSDALSAIAAETVQLQYYSSGVLTDDAGQVAGVVVVGKMANRNILNALGDVVGSYGDSSIALTSTAYTSLREFDALAAETQERSGGDTLLAGALKAVAVTTGFQNGEYCVDHRTGTFYGVKADNSTTIAVDYSVLIGVSGGGGGIASDVNVNQIGGTATVSGGVAGSLGVGGNVAHDAVDAGNPVAIGGIAKSAQQTAVAAADRVKAVFNLFGEQVIAGFTWATNSIRTEEIDPLDQKYVGETLLDLTNIAQTTTAYAYIDMAGFQTLGIQAETSGATPTDVLTITLEASMQDDGTAAASCAYQDVTNALTGSASFVDTDFISLIATPFAVKYLRVKYTTSTGGGNDCDLTIYTKKFY